MTMQKIVQNVIHSSTHFVSCMYMYIVQPYEVRSYKPLVKHVLVDPTKPNAHYNCT
jgi:hypothetical protein